MNTEHASPSGSNVEQRLDSDYGKLQKPKRIDLLEGQIFLRSLQRLNADTAQWLRAFMSVTEQGLGVTRYVYCELPILWVVDKSANILFSIEEIVNTTTRDFAIPRIAARGLNITIPDGHCRLGHPALIGGEAARNGGEIRFDVRATPAVWIIDNSSGRYGFRRGSRDHLSNVRQRFNEHGIELNEVYYPRRGEA